MVARATRCSGVPWMTGFPLGDGRGLTGPDKARAASTLFVPPGYTGSVPERGYHVARPKRTGWSSLPVFVQKGDFAGAVANVKAKAALFPAFPGRNLRRRRSSMSPDINSNTISANDFSFYEELNAVAE